MYTPLEMLARNGTHRWNLVVQNLKTLSGQEVLPMTLTSTSRSEALSKVQGLFHNSLVEYIMADKRPCTLEIKITNLQVLEANLKVGFIVSLELVALWFGWLRARCGPWVVRQKAGLRGYLDFGKPISAKGTP